MTRETDRFGKGHHIDPRRMAGIRLRKWLRSVSLATFFLFSAAVQTTDASEADSLDTIPLEEMVVTSTRTTREASELPGNVRILDLADLQRSPGLTTDDVLRQIPGFTLFRRTGSITAHPTTQGVSLRGTGASGASRTLVLLDGMPLNDPFGGWVQWGKVPLGGVQKIEVIRGGSANLWGNYALSGVVNLVTANPDSESTRWGVRAGTGRTVGIDLLTGRTSRGSRWSISASYLGTGGYYNLKPNDRGTIDRRVSSRTGSARLFGTRRLTTTTDATAHIGVFADDRDNGTALTGNNSKSAYGAFDLSSQQGTNGRLTLSVFGQIVRFSSTFSSQASDRESERPALDQFNVPSYAVGASFSYTRRMTMRHLFTVGLDARRLTGSTNEHFFYGGNEFIRRREAGGRQTIAGLFAQNIFFLPRQIELTVGGRWDRWENEDGYRQETNLETGDIIRDDRHQSETDSVFGPRAGIEIPLGDVSMRAAGYATFRSPTLNELYRPFRVGNVITAANAGLDGERLRGMDFGFDYERDGTTGSVTAYWNEIEGSVANVTLAGGPGNIDPCGFVPNGGLCRQRLNLERMRVRGIEADIEFVGDRTAISLGYLFTETEIRRASDPSLIGKRLPQIPKQTAFGRLSYQISERSRVSVQARAVGNQYEDNANSLPLDAYALVDVIVARRLGKGKEAFLQVDNLLNASYAVGISGTGLRTVGAPLLLSVGIRSSP